MTQQSSSRSGQRNTTADLSQQSQNTATGTMREMADQVKETAGQVTDQAQQTAGQVVDQARQQVSSRLGDQKDRAAESLVSVAQALRQTGQQLREQDQQGVTHYIDQAASRVERLSNYLQQNDLGQLVDDVEQMARRQPALFLGGAFVLGLLGARFLKSSRPYTGPSGSYSGGFSGGNTYMAQRQQRYYTGYPSEEAIREANAVPNYGPGTKSGPYTTTGHTTTGQPASTGRARLYDPRREE